MVCARARLIVIGSAMLGLVSFCQQPLLSIGNETQPPKGPVRIEGGSFIVESSAGGPGYVVLGTLKAGKPVNLYRGGNVVIPRERLASVAVYELKRVFPCPDCNACNGEPPPPECLSPPVPTPPPPPPSLAGRGQAASSPFVAWVLPR